MISLSNIETVGAIVKYKDEFLFMLGPDKNNEKLRLVRLGGHIEKNEKIIEALKRELHEEAKLEVQLINSSKTYFKNNWDDREYSILDHDFEMEVQPLIRVGNKERATLIFLALTDDEPIPSAESNAIAFITKEEIKDICTSSITLKEYISNGGKVVFQNSLDENKEICAGVHLQFLNELIENEKIEI